MTWRREGRKESVEFFFPIGTGPGTAVTGGTGGFKILNLNSKK
jgi:hypothetical protein